MGKINDMLAELARDTADKVPPGWETLNEIAAAEGRKPEPTRKKLTELTRAGRLESKIFKLYIAGQLRDVRHWRFPDQPKKK